jgi:hypothetical protein
LKNSVYRSKIHEIITKSDLGISLGTQKYIALLGVIIEALYQRKILWIDELDSRFHENLLKMIISLFNSKDNNPNGAQLICTCHNTSSLKKYLRRDQMVFVERDERTKRASNSKKSGYT